MKTKSILLALVLSAAPTLVSAACFDSHDQVTMSCPEGQTFDAETQSCITPTG